MNRIEGDPKNVDLRPAQTENLVNETFCSIIGCVKV